MSDHGSLGAIPRQIQACEKYGINPIFACELYINPLQPTLNIGQSASEITEHMSPEEKKSFKKSYHLLAIAYSQKGYSNLVNLSSAGWTRGFYYRPRVNYELLQEHKEGLIFTSCCYNSEIGQAFDRGGDEEGFRMVEKYIEFFGKDNFYLELMLLDFNKQKPYNKFIIRAHEKYNLPVILSNDCLVEDTLVLTNLGNKKIQDLSVGDYVLTHTNKFKRVEFINSRDLNFNEKVYRVKAKLGTLAWEITGNHQVRIANKDSVSNKFIFGWKRVDELCCKDYLVVPKVKEKYIFSKYKLNKIKLLDILPKSSYCSKNGRVGTGAATRLLLRNNKFITYRGFDRRSTVEIPCELVVNNDLLKIIGLYIAEGGLDSGNQISFVLHKSELKEVNLITKYFKQFGIKVNKYIKGNGIKIEFNSVVFRYFFESICGKGCENKSLPKINGKIFGKFSKDQMITIISQYWSGDGSLSKNKNKSMVASVSKKLIYDLSYILNSLGICNVPCFREYSEKYTHKNKNANPSNSKNLYYISFIHEKNKFSLIKNMNNNNKNKCIELNDCFLIKFKKNQEINYTNKVYNIQVEKDESYVANMFQLHNCHYCLEEDSKMQRLMLMVQTKKTLAEIEQKKAENETADLFELQDTNLWMKSEEELNAKWFSDYRDSIPYELFEQAKINTTKIAQKAKGVELDRSIKLPYIPEAEEKLLEAIQTGFQNRGLPKNKKYLGRIKEEYQLICQKGFASYFLIQKMMTDEARRVCKELLGYGDGSEAVGPGRGSAVGALTCYCLGITDVNPIEHDLLFSRFLSPSRGGKQMKLRFSIDPTNISKDIVDDCPFDLPNGDNND